MALDEALLRGRIRASSAPTVRFYGWRPATVSLGYAQPLDDTVDRVRCRGMGIGLVRRPTGGSAILHEAPEREVTYSVVAREGDFPGADDVLETYRVLGQGLAAGLGRLGVAADLVPLVRGRPDGSPAFCFRRAGTYEIAVGGRKLVGSAQRRQRGSFLQHGSVLLGADPARIRAVFPARGGSHDGDDHARRRAGAFPGLRRGRGGPCRGTRRGAWRPPRAVGPLAGRERAGGRARHGQVRHGGLDRRRTAAGRRPDRRRRTRSPEGRRRARTAGSRSGGTRGTR